MTSEVQKDLRQSRVGKRTILLPKGVSANVVDGDIRVQGPKGKLSKKCPPHVEVSISPTEVKVVPTIAGRDGARYQGLTYALIHTMVKGLSEGYTHTLELHGTGYRAELKGAILNLSLGLSHPVNYPLPQGVTAQIPSDSKGTVIVLNGTDKEVMGQTAATIRKFRPPSPYGGKGVRYRGEKIREKAAKTAGGKGGK